MTIGPRTSAALKLATGAALITWMVTSGKLNLSRVASSAGHWPLLLAMLAMGYCQFAATAWRWKLLLKAQKIPLTTSRVWGLTMIGALFNVVIPGAVGGDLIKGYYITRAAPDRKSHAATTILMDRVIGLLGLLSLGAVMVLLNWSTTAGNPATRSLGLIAVVSTVGGAVGIYAALFAGQWLSEWKVLPGVLRGVFAALHDFHSQASVIPVAFAISVLSQALGLGMYYLALLAIGVSDMPAGAFFVAVPLGLVTTALPISPGGVGVGQAAFFALFNVVAPKYAATGADALTVFQLVYMTMCLSGLYWYLTADAVPGRSTEKSAA